MSEAKSDDERAAFFEELMQEERRRQPISGPAIATLVLGLLGGLLAPIVGFFALQRIRKDGERGRAFVYVGLAAFVAWVVVIAYLVTAARTSARSEPQTVSGFDLQIGQCFIAPALSGEADVVPLPCTEPHTGEVIVDFNVPDGPYPGTVELYDSSLAQCRTLARQGTYRNARIQVMTPTHTTWEQRQPHRIVCYVAFIYQTSEPI